MSDCLLHATKFMEFVMAERTPEDCLFHVIPVPYEATVCYGRGTADGPSALLGASNFIETWDGRGFSIVESGIYTAPAVDCTGRAEEVLANISLAVTTALDHGAIPVLLGGEHTVSLGALKALHSRYGSFGIVQFDAHGDLRDEFDGDRFNHGCVMRRGVELGLSLFQVAVRNISPEDMEARELFKVGHLDADELYELGGLGALREPGFSLLPPDFPKDIYITFDVDGLDPSLMPSTGTPDPGGLTWYEAKRLLDLVVPGRQVLGFDVVELAPLSGLNGPNFTAAKLARDIMARIIYDGIASR